MKASLKLVLVCVVLMASGSVKAQMRHSGCDSGIEILGGATIHGFGLQAGYVKYFSNVLYGRINAFGVVENDRGLPHRVAGGKLLLGFTLFNVQQKFYANVLAGATGSYEDSKDMRSSEEAKYKLKKYGVVGGGELEYYLGDKVSLIGNYTQSYLLGENPITPRKEVIWGEWRYHLFVGIRFHFYGSGCARAVPLHRSGR